MISWDILYVYVNILIGIIYFLNSYSGLGFFPIISLSAIYSFGLQLFITWYYGFVPTISYINYIYLAYLGYNFEFSFTRWNNYLMAFFYFLEFLSFDYVKNILNGGIKYNEPSDCRFSNCCNCRGYL